MESKQSFLDFDLVKEVNPFALFQKSIKHLNSLSSDTWTEYNIHDPGMTLIENLCVAITNISVRGVADIEEFITYKGYNTSVFTPKEAFSVYPVTVKDYRKILIDRFSQIENIWIENVSTSLTSFKGYNQLVVKFKENKYDEKLLKKILDKAKTYRSLCENIVAIELAKQVEVQVAAEIDLNFTSTTEEAIANVLFELYCYFTPNIKQYAISEIYDENTQISEMYEGPYLKRGYLYSKDLYDRKDNLLTSDIIREVMKLNEVIGIRNLGIVINGDIHYSILNLKKNIPTYDFDTHDLIQFFKNGVRCVNYNIDQVKILFDQKKLTTMVNSQNIDVVNSHKPKEKPINKAFTDKTPLIDKFPNFYHLKEKQEAFSGNEYFKNQNIKTYVSFFESFIEEYLNQLVDIPKVLSADTLLRVLIGEKENTILSSEHFRELLKINQILDFIIKINGENFEDEAILSFSKYNSKNELLKKNLLYKITFLNYLSYLLRGKCLAEVLFLDKNSCFSTLELRLILVLGLGEVNTTNWDISLPNNAFFQLLISKQNTYSNKKCLDTFQFYDCINPELRKENTVNNLNIEGLIDIKVVEYGVEYKNWIVGYNNLTNEYILLLKNVDDYYFIDKYTSWREAESIGVLLHEEVLKLQTKLETFIFVEHQKLQPNIQDQAFGISILNSKNTKVLILDTALEYTEREELMAVLPKYLIQYDRFDINRSNDGHFFLTFSIPELGVSFKSFEAYISVQEIHTIKEDLFNFLSDKYIVEPFNKKVVRHIIIENEVDSIKSIVEESFLNFSVSFFFLEVSNRFKDKEFQGLVKRLCTKYVPAHINYNLKWVSVQAFNDLLNDKNIIDKEENSSDLKRAKNNFIKSLLKS